MSAAELPLEAAELPLDALSSTLLVGACMADDPSAVGAGARGRIVLQAAAAAQAAEGIAAEGQGRARCAYA